MTTTRPLQRQLSGLIKGSGDKRQSDNASLIKTWISDSGLIRVDVAAGEKALFRHVGLPN